MLFYAHSGWRHIVILVAILALIKFIYGWIASGQWSSVDQSLLVAYPVVVTIQWFLGVILWFTRGFSMSLGEHILTMTLALIPAHMALARVRRAPDDRSKYKTATIMFVISALLVGLGVALITGVI